VPETLSKSWRKIIGGLLFGQPGDLMGPRAAPRFAHYTADENDKSMTRPTPC
jgi:hypothetical protein